MNQIEELKKQGYDLQNGKILAGTPRRVERFNALGLQFVCIRGDKGKIIKHGWTAVTKAQAMRLKDVLDPVTNEPYLRFGYVPMPSEMLKSVEQKSIDRIDLEELNGKDKSGVDEVELSAEGAKPEEDAGFDELQQQTEEKSQSEETPEAGTEADEDSEKKVSASQVERAELEKKSLTELKKILKNDLGIEIPRGASKDELIEMIVG